jgi:hypothetical protein
LDVGRSEFDVQEKQMPGDVTADEVCRLLKLESAMCGFQLLIPGNTFHTARVIPESFRGWFLGASTEWPGVEPGDVEIANLEVLAAKYPSAAEDLRARSSAARASDQV